MPKLAPHRAHLALARHHTVVDLQKGDGFRPFPFVAQPQAAFGGAVRIASGYDFDSLRSLKADLGGSRSCAEGQLTDPIANSQPRSIHPRPPVATFGTGGEGGGG
jgi:hypothetical protein